MSMSDKLSDGEIDGLLERFDRTDNALQRRIIAEFILRLDLATSLLRSVDVQCGNASPGNKRHSLTPVVRDEIRDFLNN
jgi:hypothetical protein